MRVESSTLVSIPLDIILNSNFQIIHISPKLCWDLAPSREVGSDPGVHYIRI